MNPETIATLIRIGANALDGTAPSPAEVARALVGVGLDLVPVAELRAYLTDEARRRDELAANLAEEAKLRGAP